MITEELIMFWWIVKIALCARAGFGASRLMKSGEGMIWNIVLGLIGGVVGSAVASLIGLKSTNVVGTLLISLGGACLVIYLYRIIAPKFKK